MPACRRCGEYHDTPRTNKNCEKRFRYSQSSPKAPETDLWPIGTKFNEELLYSAYKSWIASLDQELSDIPHN